MNKALSRREAETLAAETLETELARIAALSLDDLRALWLKMTGQGVPRALSRDLLARMIAHRIQEPARSLRRLACGRPPPIELFSLPFLRCDS
jgi:hypothetical protein